LHRADDIAALAHPAERIGEIRRQAPMRRAELGREAEPFQRLQSTGPDRLIERAARGGTRQSVRFGITDQRTVDAG